MPLTSAALEFITNLHRAFNPTREALLQKRAERQQRLQAGELPAFIEHPAAHAEGWRVAPTPLPLQNRQVEITGPVERKMMINALNSGAQIFMADCEDALSPTWSNITQGQLNLIEATRRTLALITPEGKDYRLHDQTATLLVRPRGWHLTEKHVLVDGAPISASLFDFGLYFFHNAAELITRGSGPYFYLPKLESHLEARLWNDVFNFAQETLNIPRGTIRATVLIETILAAFEMEEILYELREHASGLNAGRWDYIFSAIKKFNHRADCILPDRVQVTMTVPFMRAYTERLVQICHKRGAHAIGGMAAFIPSRKDPQVNETALAKVREDKTREANAGFDGTWVAHPDLVPTAQEVFSHVLGAKPHQKDRLRPEVNVTATELATIQVPDGQITEAGLCLNVSVALQYLDAWLTGNGAAAINNLMEDAATAEISRSQIWQWIRHGARLTDGRPVTRELYQQVRAEELTKLGGPTHSRLNEAVRVLDGLILNDTFIEFLTLSAYELLE